MYSEKDISVNSWQKIKGKKVYLMGRGMTPDVMFRYLCGKNNLIPDKDFFPDYSFPTHLELEMLWQQGKPVLQFSQNPW